MDDFENDDFDTELDDEELDDEDSGEEESIESSAEEKATEAKKKANKKAGGGLAALKEKISKGLEATNGKSAKSQVKDDSAGSGEKTETAYVPNFKFLIGDQEVEVDPRLHPILKDKETEEYIKSMYERFHGFDKIKGQYDETAAKLNEALQWRQTIESAFGELDSYRKSDFGRFLQKMGVSDQDVIEYVKQLATSTPESMERLAAERRAADAERANHTIHSNIEKQYLQAHDRAVDSLFKSPNISAMATDFDKRVNSPGRFRKLFDDFGTEMCLQAKQYLPPEQVFAEFSKIYGPLLTAQQQQAQVQQHQASEQSSKDGSKTRSERKGGSTIPNVGTGTGSTVQKRFKSLKEMKAAIKERAREED